MNAETLTKFIKRLSRVTAVLGTVIIVFTIKSMGQLVELLTIKSFFVFYGALLIKYAVDIHRKLTPVVVHQYYSAIAVPMALVPIFLFLGPEKSTTVLKVFIAFLYFISIGVAYKMLLAKSGDIIFGRAIID